MVWFQVTPNPISANLNPDADVFQSKIKPADATYWDFLETDIHNNESKSDKYYSISTHI